MPGRETSSSSSGGRTSGIVLPGGRLRNHCAGLATVGRICSCGKAACAGRNWGVHDVQYRSVYECGSGCTVCMFIGRSPRRQVECSLKARNVIVDKGSETRVTC